MNAKTEDMPRRRGGVAWWAIFVGIAGVTAAIAVIDVAEAVGGIASLGILVAGLAALGLAGWVWGYDSRDGADWRSTPDPARR